MKRLPTGISPRMLGVIRTAARGALAVSLLLSSPFLFEFVSQGIEWTWGCLGICRNPWEALLWFR